MSEDQAPDKGKPQQLRIVGEQPTAFDIITKPGVMEALTAIFNDSVKEERGDDEK